MDLTRRIVAGQAAGPAILKGQQGALTARIKIDTERVIGDIDPKLYGNFIDISAAALMAASSKRSRLFPTRTGFAKT